MTNEIISLKNLYTHTKEEFRNIKIDYINSELEMLDITLQSIRQYFDRLLEIIPKDISICFGDRLKICLEKTFFYDTEDSKNNTMSIVLIEDKYAFHEHSVLDRKYEGLCCGFGDEITTFIQTDTLEYLISNWKEIKKAVMQQVTTELKGLINHQIDMLNQKIVFLETLEKWRV